MQDLKEDNSRLRLNDWRSATFLPVILKISSWRGYLIIGEGNSCQFGFVQRVR
jgi:hypothetical protein